MFRRIVYDAIERLDAARDESSLESLKTSLLGLTLLFLSIGTATVAAADRIATLVYGAVTKSASTELDGETI